MTNKKIGTTYSSTGSGNVPNIIDIEFCEPIGFDESEDEFEDSCNTTVLAAKTKYETKKGPMDRFCKNPKMQSIGEK